LARDWLQRHGEHPDADRARDIVAEASTRQTQSLWEKWKPRYPGRPAGVVQIWATPEPVDAKSD
jgi:hypothetical protein